MFKTELTQWGKTSLEKLIFAPTNQRKMSYLCTDEK